MTKIKKTIFIAIFVSIAGQIRFMTLTNGFIIALSVAVMAIFIYCYEDLSPVYISFCSGIFSPMLRLLIAVSSSEQVHADEILPDAVFFFAYGIFYTLIYKYILKVPKSTRNFPYVILFCDFFSNIIELILRSIVTSSNVLTLNAAVYLLIIAICRTILIQVILMAMEAYSNLLLRQEHDKAYRQLLVLASIFESELHVMEKNAVEIEEIMRQAFFLYKQMETIDAPKELKNVSLDISKNAHEIKGDYLNIISVLRDAFLDDVEERKLSIRDIVAIEKAGALSMIKSKNLKIEIVTRIKVDFYVNEYFKMMSILRNLLSNGIEAIGNREGKIRLSLCEEGDSYVIEVKDNGTGIAQENLEAVFYEGYSTKFSEETGDVQRGIGLTLVKDYVENIFDGCIQVESEKGLFTQFQIRIPKNQFEEA